MLFVVSLFVRALARLLVGSSSEGAKDVEILVLISVEWVSVGVDADPPQVDNKPRHLTLARPALVRPSDED